MDHENPNYTLLQDYQKLRQKIITNYGSFVTNYSSRLLQITAALLQITAKIYYKLRQLLFLKNSIYYKLRQVLLHIRQFLVLLHITANFIIIYGRHYKLRRYYELRRNMP